MSAKKLNMLLQPLVEDLGFEFVGLNFSSSKELVIYIEHPDGISVENCELVSRETAAVLDVEDPIPGHYTLQVSSPGLDRPLFTLAHYRQFTGEEVKMTLFAPQDGRRRFNGIILGTTDDQVVIEQDGTELVLDLGNIAKARLVPDYDSLFAESGQTSDA